MGDMDDKYGMSAYIGDHKGIFGIIKQRISDFAVNEWASGGDVVRLTSEEFVHPPSNAIIENAIQPSTITEQHIQILELLSEKKLAKELKPSMLLVKSDDSKCSYEKISLEHDLKINASNIDKEERTLIHFFIKCHYSNLNSTCKEIDGTKYICINKKKSNSSKSDQRNEWPKSKGFVHFVLYKENIGTMEAVNAIAAKIKLNASKFAYAGTKDKRGKTSQLCSIFQVAPKNIFMAVKRLRNIRVGNFTFQNRPQSLGQARGNHFKIVLREVVATDEEIDSALSSLKEFGFINYFGSQRFSTSEVATHRIGIELLNHQWKKAIDLILNPRDNDLPQLAEAKLIWSEKGDAVAALNAIRDDKGKFSFRVNHSGLEVQLITAIAELGPSQLLNAIERIPRNMRLMYLHAYQSYLWNKVVSRRIQKYGMKVLPNDIVRTKERQVQEQDPELDNDSSDIEMQSEASEEPTPSTKGIRVLQETELADIDMTQVVIPLPGYDVVYPSNEVKQWYSEMLQENGLTFKSFKQRIKFLNLKGAYRCVTVRPKDMTWTTCFYDDITYPLIESDADRLDGISVDQHRLKEGRYKALVLEFSLPSSAYATMALRQVMKMDTSSQYHTLLNSQKSSAKQSNLKRSIESEEELKSKKEKLDI